MLIVDNYSLPTYVKEVCVCRFTFYPIPEVPPHLGFLPPPSSITSGLHVTNPLVAFPVILMYKIRR